MPNKMHNLIDAANLSMNEKILMKQMLDRGKFTLSELGIIPTYKEVYEELWKNTSNNEEPS